MKKQLFIAMTIAAVGFCGYRLATGIEPSRGNPSDLSAGVRKAKIDLSPEKRASIEKGRIALQTLESDLLSIIGPAKKTKGLNLYIAGKTDAEKFESRPSPL